MKRCIINAQKEKLIEMNSALRVIRVAVNDRVKKIAELACSLPSADDHVEAAEAIIRSEEARS